MHIEHEATVISLLIKHKVPVFTWDEKKLCRNMYYGCISKSIINELFYRLNCGSKLIVFITQLERDSHKATVFPFFLMIWAEL